MKTARSNRSRRFGFLGSLAVVAAGLIPLAAPSAARAEGGTATVVVAVGTKLVKDHLIPAVRRWNSEHTRYYPDGNICNIPMKDLSGSRISFNFDQRSWVPRGSKPIRVRLEVHGVPDSVRQELRLVMKADKRGRKDRDRSTLVKHGSTFELKYGTSGDRAYYFVERGTNLAPRLPEGA